MTYEQIESRFVKYLSETTLDVYNSIKDKSGETELLRAMKRILETSAVYSTDVFIAHMETLIGPGCNLTDIIHEFPMVCPMDADIDSIDVNYILDNGNDSVKGFYQLAEVEGADYQTTALMLKSIQTESEKDIKEITDIMEEMIMSKTTVKTDESGIVTNMNEIIEDAYKEAEAIPEEEIASADIQPEETAPQEDEVAEQMQEEVQPVEQVAEEVQLEPTVEEVQPIVPSIKSIYLDLIKGYINENLNIKLTADDEADINSYIKDSLHDKAREEATKIVEAYKE